MTPISFLCMVNGERYNVVSVSAGVKGCIAAMFTVFVALMLLQ